MSSLSRRLEESGWIEVGEVSGQRKIGLTLLEEIRGIVELSREAVMGTCDISREKLKVDDQTCVG